MTKMQSLTKSTDEEQAFVACENIVIELNMNYKFDRDAPMQNFNLDQIRIMTRLESNQGVIVLLDLVELGFQII